MPLDEIPEVDLTTAIKPAGKSTRVGRKTFCITGVTGAGKTTSITTIPLAEKGKKAGLVLDFDGKSQVVSDLRPDDIDILDLKLSIDDWRVQRALLDEVYKNAVELAKTYPFCFADGLTNMYALGKSIAHASVAGKNNFKMNFDKMDFVDDWFFRRVQKLGAAFQYFVLFCHEDYRETENGTHRVLPLARKALSMAIPGNFQEVYHAATDGLGDDITYFWRTRPEELYGNTSSVTNLPHKIPNHFGFLLDTNWRGEKKGVDDLIRIYEDRYKTKITRWKV